jgi:oxygen-dependent protoporphyrinogen oxidase
MKKIVIIGGGIAGLAAAYRIHEAIAQDAPVECVLLESAEKFGGKISTMRFDGFIVERGPDSFISQNRRPLSYARNWVLPTDSRALIQTIQVLMFISTINW